MDDAVSTAETPSSAGAFPMPQKHGVYDGCSESFLMESSVGIDSSEFENDKAFATPVGKIDKSPELFADPVTKDATRTLKITGSSLGRYGGTHVQSSDSHSAVREKIIQSEDVAPGQKLFSFGPASTAATLVQAFKVLRLTADTHLARTHVKIPATDAEAVITRIRDVLEQYSAAVQTNNEKGKLSVSLYTLQGACTFVVQLYSTPTEMIVELNRRTGNPGMLVNLNKHFSATLVSDASLNKPLTPLVKQAFHVPADLMVDDVNPAEAYQPLVTMLKSPYGDLVLEGLACVCDALASHSGIRAVSSYEPLLRALVDVLAREDNLDAVVIAASLSLATVTTVREGCIATAQLLQDTSRPYMSRVMDESRGGAELAWDRQLLARRHCVAVISNLCGAYANEEEPARVLLDKWRSSVETVLNSASASSDARTQQAAKTALECLKNVHPVPSPWSLNTTHVTVAGQTLGQVKQSVETALMSHDLPFVYNAQKHKFQSMAWSPLGFVRFNVRIFRPSDGSAGYVVEFQRRRGSSGLMCRLFRDMASVITATKSDEQSSPSGPAFSVVCPVAATPEAIRAGTADLTRMITSEYAEVALESALVTCSLLGQSPANVLAQDVELVAGLVDLVLKSESESTIDTRTAAAQALSMVAAQPSGLNTISSVISARGSRFFEAILKDLDASRKGVETCFLKRFLLGLLFRFLSASSPVLTPVNRDLAGKLSMFTDDGDSVVFDYAQRCLCLIPTV